MVLFWGDPRAFLQPYMDIQERGCQMSQWGARGCSWREKKVRAKEEEGVI